MLKLALQHYQKVFIILAFFIATDTAHATNHCVKLSVTYPKASQVVRLSWTWTNAACRLAYPKFSLERTDSLGQTIRLQSISSRRASARLTSYKDSNLVPGEIYLYKLSRTVRSRGEKIMDVLSKRAVRAPAFFETVDPTPTPSPTAIPTASPVTTSTFDPQLYAMHRKYLSQYASNIETEAASGWGTTYYNTSYYLNGMVSAVEATQDEEELMQLLHYIDLMISAAGDFNADGNPEWRVNDQILLDGNKRPFQLNTFQAAVPIARTASFIMNSSFRDKYLDYADRYEQFLKKSILDYWFNQESGVYRAQKTQWQWIAGQIPWLSTERGGWNSYLIQSDKCSLVGTIAAALYHATGNPFYKEIAERIGEEFKAKLQPNGSGWVWDANIPFDRWLKEGHTLETVPVHDTSHSNREPMMMMVMHDAGIVFTAEDMTRMADTLTEILSKGTLQKPQFSNYIDGSDSAFGLNKNPGDIGNVYAGWAILGQYSTKADIILRSTLDAVGRGLRVGQNGTPYGKVALSGHLLKSSDPTDRTSSLDRSVTVP